MPPASRTAKPRGAAARGGWFFARSAGLRELPGVDLRPGQVFFIELRGGEAGRVQPFPREAAEVVRRADAHGQQRREQPEERRVVRNEPARARPLREDAVLPVLFAQGEVRAECAKVGFERPGVQPGPRASAAEASRSAESSMPAGTRKPQRAQRRSSCARSARGEKKDASQRSSAGESSAKAAS